MSEETIFQQLEICQKQRDTALSQLAALRKELATMTSEFETGQQNWVDGMKRLADAERRNHALYESLDSVAFYFRQHGVDQNLREIVEESLALNKPEEAKS